MVNPKLQLLGCMKIQSDAWGEDVRSSVSMRLGLYDTSIKKWNHMFVALFALLLVLVPISKCTYPNIYLPGNEISISN